MHSRLFLISFIVLLLSCEKPSISFNPPPSPPQECVSLTIGRLTDGVEEIIDSTSIIRMETGEKGLIWLYTEPSGLKAGIDSALFRRDNVLLEEPYLQGDTLFFPYTALFKGEDEFFISFGDAPHRISVPVVVNGKTRRVRSPLVSLSVGSGETLMKGDYYDFTVSWNGGGSVSRYSVVSQDVYADIVRQYGITGYFTASGSISVTAEVQSNDGTVYYNSFTFPVYDRSYVYIEPDWIDPSASHTNGNLGVYVRNGLQVNAFFRLKCRGFAKVLWSWEYLTLSDRDFSLSPGEKFRILTYDDIESYVKNFPLSKEYEIHFTLTNRMKYSYILFNVSRLDSFIRTNGESIPIFVNDNRTSGAVTVQPLL